MKTIDHDPQQAGDITSESSPETAREISLGEQALRGLIVLALVLAVFAVVHFG